MAMLTTGPLWVVMVRAAGDQWAADLQAHLPIRAVTMTALEHEGRVVVSGRAVGDRRRVDLAWAVTSHLVALAWHDPHFSGVGLDVALDQMTVTADGDTMDGVGAGMGRDWWRPRIAVALG